MKLLKKVKILGKDYDVEYCNLRKEKEASHNTRGYICPPEQIIRVDNQTSARQTQEATLLHEIIHAIHEGLGIEMKEEHVCQLTAGLYQVLNDNGFLIKS